MQQIVYALGDVHADFTALNTFINKKIRSNSAMRALAKDDELEVILLQCGDFCFFWPPFDYSTAIKNKVDFLHDKHVKIYWCAGNHENHDMLDALQAQHAQKPFIEVAPSIYFATFGAVLSLLDGTKVLFCGGAESEIRDKQRRLEHERRTGHRAWWPQEGISDKDMQALPKVTHAPHAPHAPHAENEMAGGIDWVVSHARPLGVALKAKTHHGKEASQSYLEEIRQRYAPKKWLHGHYHVHEENVFEGCEFVCLHHATSRAVWYKLLAHMGSF